MGKPGRFFVLLMLTLAFLLNGCSTAIGSQQSNISSQNVDLPALPEKLELNTEGIPILKVYDVSSKTTEEMNLEDYVMGVIAGEMKNDWPLEALKAQAILARTFVLKFCDTKTSQYDNADISTDIEEAQAYAPDKINDNIRRAVQETEGMVMSDDGEYPFAWFFAHSGGKTELPSIALDFPDEDPDYLEVTDSPDSEKAPENVKNWIAEFTFDQIQAACSKAGLEIESIQSIEAGERGESGRLKTLLINGNSVSAPSLRIHLGASKLKSTLIDEINLEENRVIFSGRGYGHGVGMSQWGAYALAEEGRSASDIIYHYFDDIDIVDLW